MSIITISFDNTRKNQFNDLADTYIKLHFSDNGLKPRFIETLRGIDNFEILDTDEFEKVPAILLNLKPIRGEEKAGYSFNQTIHLVIEKANESGIGVVLDKSCLEIDTHFADMIKKLKGASFKDDALEYRYQCENAKLHGLPKPQHESTEKKEIAVDDEELALTLAFLAAENYNTQLNEPTDEELLKSGQFNELAARKIASTILEEIKLRLITLKNEVFDETKEMQLAKIDSFISDIRVICESNKEANTTPFYPDTNYTIFDRAIALLDHSLLISDVNDLAMLYGLNGKETMLSFEDTFKLYSSIEKEGSQEPDLDSVRPDIHEDPIEDENKMPIEKITRAIHRYLTWMDANAKGTRGITRFSHWYHGDSGKARAEELMTIVNDSNSSLQEIIKKLQEVCSKSSNTEHSLKSFLINEFGNKAGLDNVLNSTSQDYHL